MNVFWDLLFSMTKKWILMAILIILISLPGAYADVVTITAGADPSYTDLFNGVQNVDGASVLTGIDLRDGLGGFYGSTEPGSLISANDTQSSHLDFWTGGTVTINQLVVSLSEDTSGPGAGARSVADLNFFYHDGFEYLNAYSTVLDADYLNSYGSHAITVTVDFDTAISADAWRVQWSTASGEVGGRILEVDGNYVIPEPSTMAIVSCTAFLGLIIKRVSPLFNF